MNCEQAKELIYQRHADTGLHAHLENCEQCRGLYATERSITDCLRQQNTAIDDELNQRQSAVLARAMHQIRANEARRSSKRNFSMGAGLGFAFAASLFIALFGTSLFTELNMDTQAPISSIEMTVNTQRSVNIMFESPVTVAEATITIYLPDNISIAGYSDVNELSWNTALKQGKNALALPLLANSDGRGIIRSQLQVGDDTRSFNLVVDVSAATSNIHTQQTLKV